MIRWNKHTKYFVIWVNTHGPWYDWFVHIGLQYSPNDSRAKFGKAIGLTLKSPIYFTHEHYVEGFGWADTHERRSGRVEEFLKQQKSL